MNTFSRTHRLLRNVLFRLFVSCFENAKYLKKKMLILKFSSDCSSKIFLKLATMANNKLSLDVFSLFLILLCEGPTLKKTMPSLKYLNVNEYVQKLKS